MTDTITYTVSDMTCGHCKQAVTHEVSAVEGDRRLVGREVDARLDPFELVQLPFDACGAGGAGHAADLEAHALIGRAGRGLRLFCPCLANGSRH